MTRHNLISLLGLLLLMGIGWAFSNSRRRMNGRLICAGVLLQLGMGLLIFKAPGSAGVFLAVNDCVVKVLDSAGAGARFVFGRLAEPAGTPESLGFILAFQGFPTIIFFSALIALLYYFGIMFRVVQAFAAVFRRLMRTSGAESLVAGANIFVGVEAALTVRPYLAGMTVSELCTVLTTGMASVASNVLALYVYTLRDQFPTIAGHLISASLLSAPAALVMSKILYPETDTPETLGMHVRAAYEREASIFEAIIQGAQNGVRMIVGIVGLLIAVLGLVALLNLILGAAGGPVNRMLCVEGRWSIEGLCAYLFYPLVLILGVPASEAWAVARIVGERLVLTEVVAYGDLAKAMKEGQIHGRSAVITAYALCGFAHLASMAIFVGGTAALVPNRTRDISCVAVRALIAATLACLMTACVAGAFFTEGSVLLGQYR